jgi:hypothetical protein
MMRKITEHAPSSIHARYIGDSFKALHVKHIEIEYFYPNNEMELWACTQKDDDPKWPHMRFTEWYKFGVFSNTSYADGTI